jgi:exosortase A-associated hydrolase 2
VNPAVSELPARGFFLPSQQGAVLARYFPARCANSVRHDVILVPPFAEEMNRSRRMFSLVARRLAAVGIGALLLDLYGTGDSDGDFGDARWHLWQKDLASAEQWLRSDGAQRISLLGLRLGAMLAADYARQPHTNIEQLILWQPVLNGEAIMTQFLRLRLAASMLDSVSERTSTQDLRRQLAEGNSLEIAGYELAPELVSEIDQLRLEPLASPRIPAVHWLEVVADATRQLPPAAQRLIDAWQVWGVNVAVQKVIGPPFWQLAEITLAPMLLETTTSIFLDKVTA